MIKQTKNLQALKQALEKEKISLVIRQNDNGIIYGLTYIDHHTKCVFNGSDIGKDYSAKAILEKCGVGQTITPIQISTEHKISDANSLELSFEKSKQQSQELSKIIDAIITPTEQYQYVPFELRKRKKKKRKSGS